MGLIMEEIALELIHVLAVITAKKGMRKHVLEAFHQNSSTVRQEKGCMEYMAAVDADDAGALQTKLGDETFVVVEKWENRGALKDHAASPGMAAFAERTKDLIESRIIHVLSPTVGA